MKERVGFIGLGLMGKPMATNLLARGYPLVVHSRSRGPVDALVAAGAAAADIARGRRPQTDVIITMVPDTPDVEAVLEGPDRRVQRAPAGSLLIDTSSIAPAVRAPAGGARRELGAVMLDAPVSGGEIGAINASLSIMVGGDAAVFERALPMLEAMGDPNGSSTSAARVRASCVKSATRWSSAVRWRGRRSVRAGAQSRRRWRPRPRRVARRIREPAASSRSTGNAS